MSERAPRTFYFMTCKSRVNKIYSRAHLDAVLSFFEACHFHSLNLAHLINALATSNTQHDAQHIRQRSCTKRRAPQHTQITIAAKIMRELYSKSSSFGYAPRRAPATDATPRKQTTRFQKAGAKINHSQWSNIRPVKFRRWVKFSAQKCLAKLGQWKIVNNIVSCILIMV
jgi:hypothetical protein